MVSTHLYTVVLCIIATEIIFEPMEVAATLPIAKEIKESKLTKAIEVNKDPKIMFKADGKKFVISNTPKINVTKKNTPEKQELVKAKTTDLKGIKSKIAALSAAAASKSSTQQRTSSKPTPKPKPNNQKAIVPKKNNQNKISASEKYVPESKIIEMIEKRISPILNTLTKAIKTGNTDNLNAKDPSKLVKQIDPVNSLEVAESFHRGVRHIKDFMQIVGQVENYLTKQAREAFKHISYIYGGNERTKGKQHRFKKRKF